LKPFTVLILLAVIILGDIVSGTIGIASPASTTAISGCNNPVSLEQCGTGSCTISGSAFAPNQYCVVTITFPSPFSSIPKFASITFAGFNNGFNHPEKAIPAFSKSFESDNGETWANFPAALTEIYGDVNHEVPVSSEIQQATEASFSTTCLAQAGTQTGSETLRPEYFDSGSGTWKQLSANNGQLDLNVGAIFCGTSGSDTQTLGPVAFDTNAISGATAAFRVVGFGGGGAGDSMTFNEIHLVFYNTILETPSLCISIVSLCPHGLNLISKTKMEVDAEIAFALPTSNYQVNMNWIASE
jgi:hypothetical protein